MNHPLKNIIVYFLIPCFLLLQTFLQWATKWDFLLSWVLCASTYHLSLCSWSQKLGTDFWLLRIRPMMTLSSSIPTANLWLHVPEYLLLVAALQIDEWHCTMGRWTSAKAKDEKSVAFDIFKPPWVLKLLSVRFLLTGLHDVIG